ncbi:hypothetical protein M9980_01420 [Sphingomonas donggukensis]|uniref:ATP-binding protein n=1 Tax=Sphingomonas donggukensis TaxID=2949093 RepID=A0ABY4TUA9_9SPHN|nr:HEAT repeat domain-containing protein [Sphingomonas donggukensis]URW75918.1 hypothetical protein M9980_01420 [Sphingomonas donggukensis]
MNKAELTGGQLCVRGIVQQAMRGLAHSTSLVLKLAQFENAELLSAQLTLEPNDGGDFQCEAAGERLVEQDKIRTNGKPWTSGNIAADVLPDLLKSVQDDGRSTRYRFATDGSLNCDTLLDLCAALKGRAAPDDPLAALDDNNKKAFKYQAWLSERGFFKALAKSASCTDYRRFWRLLASLEIEGDLTEHTLITQIDAFLTDVVDAIEDIVGKRDQLIGLILRLARDETQITVANLLKEAGLPVQRVLHYSRLPQATRAALEHQLALLGYDLKHDVRPPPGLGDLGLTLIAGESGFGKSWQLAGELARLDRAGHLTVLVQNADSLTAIVSKVAEVVWHTSFDGPQTMPGLQRRLGHRYVDGDGAWLTVGVDDVQSRSLLNEMRAANWAAFGVRLLVTTPTPLADALTNMPLPPPIFRVGEFSLPQLRQFLKSHDRAMQGLPDDVIELLRTPIFADLYRRIESPDWTPLNEYNLLDRFWRHATFEARDMADHQDDPDGLAQLALTLLAAGGAYPWPAGVAKAAGLDQEARKRLVATGILRQSENGSVIIHDRVLNWVVALGLARRLESSAIDAHGSVAELIRIGQPDELPIGLSYRLGYVLLDFLWLIAGKVPAQTVAEILLGLIDDPQYRINAGNLIEVHLAGLGSRIIPALAEIAKTPSGNRGPIASLAARAMAAVGRAEPGSVDPALIGLISNPADHRAVRAGLIAAALYPLSDAIEQLWAIHLERRQATVDAVNADSSAKHELFLRRQASFDALVTTATTMPAWIESKLDQTSDAPTAEVLLELLLKVEHVVAQDIWVRTKATFRARIAAGKAIWPRAIGRFGESSDAERLTIPNDPQDHFEPAERFRALVRVDPVRASAHLVQVEEQVVRRHLSDSLAHLIRNGGPSVPSNLRARHAPGWEGMSDLAIAYASAPLLIDTDSFMALIAALEARLAEVAGQAWRPTRERPLVEFLAGTTRPDLLAILETYRESALETLLRDRLIANGGRVSLSVDSDADNFERLLLLIGGDGYGAAIAGAMISDKAFTRRDGFESSIMLPPGSAPANLLAAGVAEPDNGNLDQYWLMIALALHGPDAALYQLVMRSQSAYNDAIDVRIKRGPWPAAIAAQIGIDLESADSGTRIGATCALAMAPPPNAADLLANTLARCPDDDESALTVIRIASHLGCYEPRMLDQLKRMVNLPDATRREEALPYLAEQGDADARKFVHDQLTAGTTGTYDRSTLRAAYALSEHLPDDPIINAKLMPFVDRHHGIYPLGQIAGRLSDNGTLDANDFIDLGYSAKRLSADDTYLLVERISRGDPEEGLAIAERRYDQNPSAGGARQILGLGGANGLAFLVDRYAVEQRHEVRWIIARALRRHADRQALMTRLMNAAQGSAVAMRCAAAELLGWLPDDEVAGQLNALVSDKVPEVSDAALEAEGRRDAERHAKALIAGIADADHLGRWSRLWAVVDLADPYLLEFDSDGLAIGPLLDSMDEIFAIWTEKTLVRRKEALAKRAKRLDQR